MINKMVKIGQAVLDGQQMGIHGWPGRVPEASRISNQAYYMKVQK